MGNDNFFELSTEEIEKVANGKKHPYVRSTGTGVNVRNGPGKQYGVVAKLGYLDEVPASGDVRMDEDGVYWAKVKAPVRQDKWVTGWVARTHAEPCWN